MKVSMLKERSVVFGAGIESALDNYNIAKEIMIAQDGTILRGHLRVRAAKILGIKDVPVVVCNIKGMDHD